jgi:hypothetical protein
MRTADEVVKRITEVLKVFYKWPAIFTVEIYGVDEDKYIYVDVLNPIGKAKSLRLVAEKSSFFQN